MNVLFHSWCDKLKNSHCSMKLRADYSSKFEALHLFWYLASPYEWKVLRLDVKPQTNKPQVINSGVLDIKKYSCIPLKELQSNSIYFAIAHWLTYFSVVFWHMLRAERTFIWYAYIKCRQWRPFFTMLIVLALFYYKNISSKCLIYILSFFFLHISLLFSTLYDCPSQG